MLLLNQNSPSLVCGLFVYDVVKPKEGLPQFILKEGKIYMLSVFDPDGVEFMCRCIPALHVGISMCTLFILYTKLSTVDRNQKYY